MTYPQYHEPIPPDVRPFSLDDGTECIAVLLHDEAGTPHEVTMEAADWQRAVALSSVWRVVNHYGVPQVVSTGIKALGHPQRTWKYMWLLLANLIMSPPYRETVRHLDGNTLNFVRSNLIVRPKGARTIPLPKRERPETAREKRLNAIVDAMRPTGAVEIWATAEDLA